MSAVLAFRETPAEFAQREHELRYANIRHDYSRAFLEQRWDAPIDSVVVGITANSQAQQTLADLVSRDWCAIEGNSLYTALGLIAHVAKEQGPMQHVARGLIERMAHAHAAFVVEAL